ncbi:YncE family protein [Thermodesulfobacteriota bacterium]
MNYFANRYCQHTRLLTIGAIICGYFLTPLILTILLSGCLPISGTEKGFTRPLATIEQDAFNSARLNCFLNLKDDKGPAIRLEVSSIEILADNLRLPLISRPLKIDSTVIGTGQILLAGMPLPPGRYHRLFLTVTKAEVQKDDGKYIVLAQEPFTVEVDLASGIALEEDDSDTLLITWDLQSSLLADNSLVPDLTASPSLRQIPHNLVYVSCPDINTVFVVRADKNWVVDSFGLKGGPTSLAITPDTRQLLYVLASRDKMIKVVELSTFRIINFFPVPLNDAPTFMTISPDGQAAFLLDEKNGYLSRISLTTGQIIARSLLGHRPQYAAFLYDQNLLAVSLSLSQEVLLLDPVSLQVTSTIHTGSGPQGMTVSGNQLFIAEYGDNSVSIVDLANKASQSRLTVGFGPSRLLEAGNQIYVSNYHEGSLSVLLPGQLGVIQEIYDLGRPLEMAYDPSYFRLYIADEERGELAIIDTNSNRLMGHIFLGARPHDLEIIQ